MPGNSITTYGYTVPRYQTIVTKTINGTETVTTYKFDDKGFIIKKTDPYGNETIYERDNATRMVTKEEVWENVGGSLNLMKTVNSTYDTFGNRVSQMVTLDSGETITKEWTYDHGWIASVTTTSNFAPEKFRTEYTFYKNGGGYPKNIKEEKRVTGYSGGEPSAYTTTTYSYDSNGQLQTITRPNGNTENYTYENGYLKNANGIQYTYDERGNTETITDRNGKITTFVYDLLDRVTKVTNPLGEQTIYTYEGKLLTQVATGVVGGDLDTGHITKYNHDSLDRLESVVKKGDSGDITIAQYTYDSEDNILTVTDAEGKVTTFTYDLLNRPKTVKEPGKTVWTVYDYDALGNRIKVTDANGNSTQYNYDNLGRLETVTDGLDNTTEYSYDALGNLVKVKDARNNETTYEYDLLSRLTKETKPLGQETTYIYNDKDRLDHKIDAKNQKIEYNYRAVDNAITSIKYFNNTGDSTPAKTVTFGLDNNGNILSVIDDSIQSTAIYDYTYDSLNRVDIFTNNLVNKVLDYDYDSFGNRDKLTIKEGATPIYTIDYSYNKLEQLTNIDTPGGITSFDYFPTGRLEAKVFPNGVTGNYTYWENGDLKTLTYASSTAAQLLDLSYTYDNYSNIDTKTKDGVLYDYGYDNLYQLTGVTIPSVTSQNESFSYDEVGNRLSSIDKLNWSYDNNNQLNSYNGVSFGYDANGNTISKTEGGTTENYGYDFENRLVSYSSVTVSASYKYDPMVRRIEKDVDGVITRYLWDENVMIAELDGSGNILKTYLHNPDNNEPISMTENANTYWYLNDNLMTPQKMVDNSGAIVWNVEYKAFGEVTIDSLSTITNNLRFPGQYYDPESGLHYNRWRYYNPVIGRYSRTDPLSEIVQVTTLDTPGDTFIISLLNRESGLAKPSIIFYKKYLTRIPFEYNYYLFVNNNPLMNYDYYGLLFCKKDERAHFNIDLFMHCINDWGGPEVPILLTVACVVAIVAAPTTTVVGVGAGLLAVTATCGTAAGIIMPCVGRAIECLKPWPPCQR